MSGTSSIKGYHVYWRITNIGEKLKREKEKTIRPINIAIKVVGDANETIGHILDGLSKMVALAL